MVKYIFFVFTFLFSAGVFAQQNNIKDTYPKTDDGVILVYPTLAKDYIILKSKNPNTRIKSVSFYSILGVQVAEYFINSSYSEIRLDKMQAGKYLLRYTLSDNSQKVIQIIKQ